MPSRRQLSPLLLVPVVLLMASCSKGSVSSSSSLSSPATTQNPSTGSSATASPSDTTGASTTGTSASTSSIAAELAAAAKEPQFVAPGPAFDAAKAKGKTIMSIPINSQIPYIVDVDKVQQQVAGQLGVHWIECTNQGTVPSWVTCMNRAISQKVDLINLSQLPNPANLQPQIKAARAAGIAVISTHGPDPANYPAGTVPADGTANLTSYVVGPFVKVAQLDADYAINDSGGKADVLIVAPLEVLSAPGHVKAMQNQFAAQCPGCKVKVLNVPIADWATKLTPQIQTSLTQDPNLNYVIPIYDGMVSFVNSAITSAGRTGKVKIVSYNGDPSALSIMAKGGSVVMDIGESSGWLGLADLDAELRILSGVTPVKDEKTPLRVYTKGNVAAAGNPATFDGGFGTSYITGYSKLWGLTKPVTITRY